MASNWEIFLKGFNFFYKCTQLLFCCSFSFQKYIYNFFLYKTSPHKAFVLLQLVQQLDQLSQIQLACGQKEQKARVCTALLFLLEQVLRHCILFFFFFSPFSPFFCIWYILLLDSEDILVGRLYVGLECLSRFFLFPHHAGTNLPCIYLYIWPIFSKEPFNLVYKVANCWGTLNGIIITRQLISTRL